MLVPPTSWRMDSHWRVSVGRSVLVTFDPRSEANQALQIACERALRAPRSKESPHATSNHPPTGEVKRPSLAQALVEPILS